tara:strand:+ start:948 stop:1091 length:144 start_codon:yes stop_codon:yes gene_type:complete
MDHLSAFAATWFEWLFEVQNTANQQKKPISLDRLSFDYVNSHYFIAL